MGLMTQSLYFTGARELAVREEPLRDPDPDEVVIEAIVSGISAGTELNVFRGLAPQWRQRMDPAFDRTDVIGDVLRARQPQDRLHDGQLSAGRPRLG